MAAFDLVGTCGFCGRQFTANKGARLAKHGYTVEHGWHQGQCPASGVEALEKSPKSLLMLEKALVAAEGHGEACAERLPRERDALATARAALPGGWKITLPKDDKRRVRAEKLETSVGALEQMVRRGEWATADLVHLRPRIANWTEGELRKRPKEDELPDGYCPHSGKAPAPEAKQWRAGGIRQTFVVVECSCGARPRLTRGGVMGKHRLPKE